MKSRLAAGATIGLALCLSTTATAFADEATDTTTDTASPVSAEPNEPAGPNEAPAQPDAEAPATEQSAPEPAQPPADQAAEPDADPVDPTTGPAADPVQAAAEPAADAGDPGPDAGPDASPAADPAASTSSSATDPSVADQASTADADQASTTSADPAAAVAPTAAAPVATAAVTPSGQGVTTIADGVTAETIAQSLIGAGVTISNVVYTGSNVSVGIALGMGAIGISDGVVLSSGSVQITNGDKGGLVGPNQSDGYSGEFGLPGDADLDALVAPDTTNDAAVLEFDFVPTGSQVAFQYVFGSEEYNEYVNAYNDVFGFFINGVNCATIGGAPVSINTINGAVNSGSYVNNDPSDGTPAHNTELDGFTTVLTCTANVNPGVVNHVKLAIADSRDDALDSVVIIKQSSFTSQPAPVAHDDAYSVQQGGTLIIVVPGVTGNDSQSTGGGPLSATKISDPANGTVTINPDGSFSYVPNPGFTGTDTFTYVVTDIWGQSNVATVTVDVTSGAVTPVVTPVVTVPVVTPSAPAPAPTPAPAPAPTPTPTTVTVNVPTSTEAGPSLAATGIDVIPLGGISVTLLIAGAAATVVGRRRRA